MSAGRGRGPKLRLAAEERWPVTEASDPGESELAGAASYMVGLGMLFLVGVGLWAQRQFGPRTSRQYQGVETALNKSNS